MVPETERSWRTVVRWPVFLLGNVALLFVIGVSTIRETYQGWTVDREIRTLEAQAASLESGKVKLESLTKELASNDRVEYEARARLGLKKQGERVIVLEGVTASTSWSGGEGSAIVDVRSAEESQEEMSNPKRWWSYFFSKK